MHVSYDIEEAVVESGTPFLPPRVRDEKGRGGRDTEFRSGPRPLGDRRSDD